ncbi:hypothetical protein GCM10009736_31240 [Actinomadura bangladeshensis]
MNRTVPRKPASNEKFGPICPVFGPFFVGTARPGSRGVPRPIIEASKAHPTGTGVRATEAHGEKHPPMRKYLALPLLAGLALTLAGCELTKTVSADAVEQQIVAKFGPPFDDGGIGPATAECPEDLKGEVGATINCTVRDGKGGTYPLTVTVTSVDGDQVRFSMKEPPQPKGAE